MTDSDMVIRMVDLPPRFIAYENADISVADPYTVVFPDGSVFLFGAEPPHANRFLCRYRNFSIDNNDIEILAVPDTLMQQILKMEV